MGFLGNTVRSQRIGIAKNSPFFKELWGWELYDDDRKPAIIGLTRKLLRERLD